MSAHHRTQTVTSILRPLRSLLWLVAVLTGLLASSAAAQPSGEVTVGVIASRTGASAGPGVAQWLLAADLAAAAGTPVELKNVTAAEHTAALEAAGLPEGLIGFIVAVDQSTAHGGLEENGGDLSRLLGRATTPLIDVLRG